jgi:hypothetical protein
VFSLGAAAWAAAIAFVVCTSACSSFRVHAPSETCANVMVHVLPYDMSCWVPNSCLILQYE